MRQLFTLFVLSFCYVISSAQTVTTYAGIANDDPANNYTSTTSNVDLDQTYFNFPEGICFDPNGRLWVMERNKLRLITGGKIGIRAGNVGGYALGGSEGYKNANGTQARFRAPGSMVCDADGNIYIADAGNHCIRKVAKYVNASNTQAVSTFAGAAPTAGLPGFGTAGTADGTGTSARFDLPKDIAIGGDGNFYVTDYNNFTIRKITPAGVVTTIAGSAGNDGTTNGTGSTARFGGPWGIAMYDATHMVITDQWNTNIRMLNISTGEVTTIAGPTSGPSASHVDGTLSQARFKAPKGVVVINGIIYVADQNIIRAIDIDNDEVTTFVGDKSSFGITDGVGTNAKFTEISDLATDGTGHIYVSENSGAIASHVIRKVSIDALVARADFSATKKNLGVDERSTLTDISGGTEPTSRQWTISPTNYTVHSGSLTGETVELSFQATGFYTVTLDIDTDYGPDSKEAVNYFTVSTSTNSIQNNADHLFAVIPNPADQQVEIKLAPDWNLNNTVITMYDANGTEILQTSPGETIYTGDLPVGMYYVTVLSGDRFGVHKVIVTH